MKVKDQIIAIAELDGFTYTGCYLTKNGQSYDPVNPPWDVDYLHSYNAIIPVIQKHASNQKVWRIAMSRNFLDSPQTLCEALLRATGKWTE